MPPVSWEVFFPPLPFQDPHLAAAENNITFVFRNVVSKPPNGEDTTAQP